MTKAEAISILLFSLAVIWGSIIFFEKGAVRDQKNSEIFDQCTSIAQKAGMNPNDLETLNFVRNCMDTY